ncbi:transposase [Dehalococcoidia bacterium]|nr:transposase [Dehalococcoidia bacterium]
MLRDRYEPMDIFKIVPGLTLAMEPELAQLDKLLEDDILFQEVKDDLAKRFPHTRIISKGKVQRPTEFGRAVWLDEVDGGIISRYEILDGNPGDAQQIKPSLDHHISVFHKPPQLLTGDRGTYSADNERYAQSKGVKYIAIPKPGAKSPNRVIHEKQSWFRRGHKWRSGIEGRISLLKRRHKLGRCLYHGEDGMERWVGWGVLAHNLWVIANKTAS